MKNMPYIKHQGDFMKKLISIVFLILFSANAIAFEIFALGTSNTNSKGVADKSKSFTHTLEKLLKAEGYDVTVINSGIDGDWPMWMVNRLKDINENTRLVIFEPGPNENKSSNIEHSEKILSLLQERKMPTIYISNKKIQSNEDAELTAQKFHAYYYGSYKKNIPRDNIHMQFDMGNDGGHLTAEGCELWAMSILPLVKQVLVENNIH